MSPAASGAGRESVTVVIPTRNRWHLLATTLASVLAQEDVDLEVVIVDDGSSTPAPAEPPLDDDRVRVVRHQHSLGVARARNRGIEEARNGWIAFLDDDDVWAPTKLRCQLEAAAPASIRSPTPRRSRSSRPPAPRGWSRRPPASGWRSFFPAYNPIPAGASNVIVATDLLRTVGGFDPTFAHLADWDLWVRLAEAGRAVACDEPLVGYRLHPASMRSTANGALAELARFDRVHGRGRRPPPERIWFYRWLADGQLLAGRRASAAGTTLRGALRCRSRADSIRAAKIMLGRGGTLPRGPDPAPDADWLRPLLPGPARVEPEPEKVGGPAKLRVKRSGMDALERSLRFSSVPAGVALVYHGIHDQRSADGPTLDDVGAGTFSRQLEYVQSRFRLVPAGRLREAALGRRRGERFPLAVTLDDDLRSHVDVALPILRAASAPATFFLTGASLDGPSSFWWERVERALASEVGEELIGTRDPAEAVAIVADLPVERRNELADELLERLGGEEDGSGLRADQVAEMTAAGCEVGFHTRDHRRLTTLDPPALERAMNVGIDELTQASGSSLRTIAYPHGDADERVAAAARDAGFEAGFTTRGLAVRGDADPFLMGRLYPSVTSIADFASQITLAIRRVASGR